MAGFAQTNPWNYGQYGALGTFGMGAGTPASFGPATQVLQILPQQIQQLQQLLQIVPQQIQQLQQAVQFLPQHVAQIVLQALHQSQGNFAGQGLPAPGLSPFGFGISQPFQSQGYGVPFASIPQGQGSQFPIGQQGYVM